MLVIFRNLTKAQKTEAIKNLIEDTNPRQEFFFITLLSVILATIGLSIDNIVLIIASMLLAPLLFPILALGLALALGHWKLSLRSLFTMTIATILGIVLATGTAFLAHQEIKLTPSSYLLNIKPTVLFTLAAFISGVAAAFALTKQYLNNSMVGVAVSVALIPPIAAIGIGIVLTQENLVINATIQYCLNILAIALGSFGVFKLMDFEEGEKVLDKRIKAEEKKREREEKRANNN